MSLRGDKITYKEVKYRFKGILDERSINVWSYNLETVIAEKFEAIIKRGPLTTRIRDYYDVYMLMKTQRHNIDDNILKDAIIYTSEHRNSKNIVLNWKNTLNIIKDNDGLKKLWTRYQKEHFYAKEINFNELIDSINNVGKILNNKGD